jgi:hypothetical protein
MYFQHIRIYIYPLPYINQNSKKEQKNDKMRRLSGDV